MRKCLCIFIILLVMLSMFNAASVFSADTSSSFKACSYSISETETMNYWLFTPKNATSNMPLLIYLHGGSGKGNDINILTKNGFCKWVSEEKFNDVPAYIIFPQVSSSYKAWADVKNNLKSLIDAVVKKYSIDTNRISLTGHSMGGTGTFSIASSFPRMFSAIAPMSGSIETTDETVGKLSNIPVWAFVGDKDKIVDPQSSIDYISALQKIGADAKITIFEGADHFVIPELAYLNAEIDIVGWLISHTKQNIISEYKDNSVTVKAQIPGTYTIIFADYTDNHLLNNLKIINCELTYGVNTIPKPDNIALSVNDKIMLWKSLETLVPICEAYTIP